MIVLGIFIVGTIAVLMSALRLASAADDDCGRN